MAGETPQETIARCMRRLGELLAPILNAPRRPHETIWGYGVIDACGHVYMPGAAPFAAPADLASLMGMNIEMRAKIVARSPHRGVEKAPGCSLCNVERRIRRRTEPLHWRLN